MKRVLVISIIIILFFSCEKAFMDKNPDNTPESNFEVFWNNMDQRYALFSIKNIDWKDIYNTFRPMVNKYTTSNELWDIFNQILCILNDGHVNLIDINDELSRFDCNLASQPENFNYNIVTSIYLKGNIIESGPLLFGKIDSAGYIMCPEFVSEITDNHIDYVISELKDMNGIIIDIRNNGGGNSENAEKIQSRFINKRTLVEYIYSKTGPGHNDFSEQKKVYLSPEGPEQFLKPVAVLTNWRSFSSASFFASRMSVLPNVVLIGDTTGGGGGRPKFFDLPNGWVVRYSSNYALRPDGLIIENGVPPAFAVTQTQNDIRHNQDPIILRALTWINSQQ